MKNQYIIIALSVVLVGLSATIGIIVLDYDILDDDKIKPGTIAGDINHITEIQIQALIQTHKIQSDLLEGVEEAFAYIILDDENEKNEFYHKMGDFENRIDKYVFFDIEFDDDDIEEHETLDAISKAHTNLVASADIMFESFESGDLDLDTVLAFEENIDEIVPLIDELIEEEIEDITEHLEEIAEKINESSDDD